jgi:hypothetical protein
MLANGKLFRTVCGHDLTADCGSRDNTRLASLHETSYAEFVETPPPSQADCELEIYNPGRRAGTTALIPLWRLVSQSGFAFAHGDLS